MGETTGISWCDHTFNPWRGCTRVSEGCRHCYAETMSVRNPAVLGEWGPRGSRAPAAEAYWAQLATWDRKAHAARERRRVFCASLADVFEGEDTMPPASWVMVQEARARLWTEIVTCNDLDFLLLTKRPENAATLVPVGWARGWPSNVWFGFSAEDQGNFDARWAHARLVPAHVLWLSYEPALGPLDFDESAALWPQCVASQEVHDAEHDGGMFCDERSLDWVVAGGESGPGHRTMAPAWVESVGRQTTEAGCALFVKQDSGAKSGHQGRIPAALWARKEFPGGPHAR